MLFVSRLFGVADFFERGGNLEKLNLDQRLLCVASFVRCGSRVADIGTDHAYIPVYLLQNGISPSAVAADLREMPLKNAEKTIAQFSLTDKIQTVLSDGLNKIDKDSCDDIIIAGMGGLLIEEILSNTQWILDNKYRLILQPMSHQEDVRRFLFENGFEIIGEKCCHDSKHCYCVIAAQYCGRKKEYTPAEIYTGTLNKNGDEASKIYLQKQLNRLSKRHNALKNAAIEPNEVLRLAAIIDDFKRITEDTKW